MRKRTKKITAWFFLINFSFQTLYPGAAYALTSGPAQPEMQKFETAGVSDMVDLFSGNFKQNIPLVDVGGYPVNLSYQSESGIEDEASWVGVGWSLNPGSINRSMRGWPDEFKGTEDVVMKEYSRKKFQKIGGQIVIKPSLLAWEFGSASLKLNVYKDNYYGMGASLGTSLNVHTSSNNSTMLTAGIGVETDSRDGVSINPYLSVSKSYDDIYANNSGSLTGGFTYNTRAGLKQVDLGLSFSSVNKWVDAENQADLSATKYFGQSHNPTTTVDGTNQSYTFSFDAGASIFGGYFGLGGAGYLYEQDVKNYYNPIPAYGYINYLEGRKNPDAQVDFNREKDGVFISSTPAIPVPVATPDLFMATSQGGSQQFRPYFSGNYTVFDRKNTNFTLNAKAGITIGGGNTNKAGARLDLTVGDAVTQKWVTNNHYLDKAEAGFSNTSNPSEEAVYIKQSGELTRSDNSYLNIIGGSAPQKVALSANFNRAKTEPAAVEIKKSTEQRETRTSSIRMLSAVEATKYGLDKEVTSYGSNNWPSWSSRRFDLKGPLLHPVRKGHHISEVTVTDNEGKRMVYGIPVYNFTQREVNFSVGTPENLSEARRTGLMQYGTGDNSRGNKKGRDWLFTKETLPAYPTSFLLTGMLSPDYVDVKGDGITDDDMGTAVRFNYTRLNNNYQWRAPYAANTANYNEGFLSDTKDDKASYVYGEKESWYLEAIESKTMIAFFRTSNREDALGVNGENGGKNTGTRLKKLDRIELYSKAEWVKDSTNAIPIKVVHFEYDYSLYGDDVDGMPNNAGNLVDIYGNPVEIGSPFNVNAKKGKLTLKKVYFTFGTSTRGQSNPYEFEYDTRLIRDGLANMPAIPAGIVENTDKYETRQQDRWGTFKQSWYNRPLDAVNRTFTNSEFPYTLQSNDNTAFDERALNNRFVSKWQLNKITTPSGAVINIEYETDDYAYVQNRRAMQMCFIKGVGDVLGQSNEGMINAGGFTIELPQAITGDSEQKRNKLKQLYLTDENGRILDNIFFKVLTRIDNSHYEYVYGYAELLPDTESPSRYTVSEDGKSAFIPLKKVDAYNPVSRAAWQMLKSDLPQFAYDAYDNSDARDFSDNFQATLKSIVASIKNLREIVQPFEQTASSKKYANKIDLSKSMVRLCNPDGHKMGGGSRVRTITINDQWNEMSGGAPGAKYGQRYDYVTKDVNGNTISSGVASYEPQIGNEENPFHEPVPYTEKVHWSADKYHYMEKPFCESYFPAPSVGYSKITVTSFGSDYDGGELANKRTGYTENEFYTAKDFPTLVNYTNLTNKQYENSIIMKLFASTSVQRVATSQGFVVELNDMHGKPKSVAVFDKGSSKLSSTEYFYNVKDQGATEKELDNDVDVLQNTATVKGAVVKTTIATDVDFTTDVRESANESIGGSIAGYQGGMIIPLAFVTIYIPYISLIPNASIMVDTYNSVSSVKVINRYGILKKTVTVQNGSSISAENILWDGETGQVLLTKTQNEFNDYTYAFNYPAHMVEQYAGMSGAYLNEGNVFLDFETNENGKILNSLYENYLFPGDELGYVFPADELISVALAKKGWIVKSPKDYSLRFVDAAGNFIKTKGRYVTIRSGHRNHIGTSIGSIVTMVNPIATGVLKLDVNSRVLDAKAAVYKDEWGAPVPPKYDHSEHCIKVYPYNQPKPKTNFMVWSNNDYDCMKSFGGTQDGTTYGRGFLSFGPLYNFTIPAGAIIQSAKLSLYADISNVSSPMPVLPMTPGSNAAYLNRILEFPDCTVGVTWASQPAITTDHQVLLPASTGSTQNYTDIDITSMFQDWYNGGSVTVNEFGLRIKLADEGTSSPSTKRMLFYSGGYTAQESQTPMLEICYQMNEDCTDPVNKMINPYTQGVLGNWRPEASWVYTTAREQKPGITNQNGGTNIRESGYYSQFEPFWVLNPYTGNLASSFYFADPKTSADRWMWSGRSVHYDLKGNPVESVDPLYREVGEGAAKHTVYRYSSALFGYRESVATAVATNARRNEIAFDGFEDYYFSLGANDQCPVLRHFDWGIVRQPSSVQDTWCSPAGCVDETKAHSGRYSYKLNGTTTVTKSAGNDAPPASLLGYDDVGRVVLLANEQSKGFGPIVGKKYLLSMWVNDNTPASNKVTGLQVNINGQSRDLSNIVVPVVEGWKRLDLTFDAGSTFSLQLTGSNIYIDDVRILPYDGQLASYVYDDKTMRLVAQLDENNFATFYEYDDEGTPVRVKKETERGIMTLKENRQSFKKRN
ncbi:MAG: DNRLRE domain-containing protein [Chitinophagaceae bacterium]